MIEFSVEQYSEMDAEPDIILMDQQVSSMTISGYRIDWRPSLEEYM
jgi:hypothetical protein